MISNIDRNSLVASGKGSAYQFRRWRFSLWVRKIPWRRERLPTPVLWPREFHGVAKSQTLLSNFHFTSEVPCCCPLWGKTCQSLAFQDGCSVQHWGSLSKPIRPHTSYPETFSSVQFSLSVVSDSLWPHELQHARPPCPSPSPGVHSNSLSSSWWCHPAISSSVVPFSSCS